MADGKVSGYTPFCARVEMHEDLLRISAIQYDGKLYIDGNLLCRLLFECDKNARKNLKLKRVSLAAHMKLLVSPSRTALATTLKSPRGKKPLGRGRESTEEKC